MPTTHIYGTCPTCRDRRMAFEPTDATHAQCGGCGTIVLITKIEREGTAR